MAAAKEKRRDNDRVPVFLRLKPDPVARKAIEFIDEQNVKLTDSSGPPQRFSAFKCVFPESAGQEQVFKASTLPLVESLLDDDGNALLMVYGASGSGKTHTVSGGREDVGLLPMTLSLLLHRLEKCVELVGYKPRNFDEVSCDTGLNSDRDKSSSGVWISIVQVFNEALTDLLDESSHKPITVAQDARGQCFARDAKWEAVETEAESLRILQEARSRQRVASTKLNDSSSRSHFIVFVKVIRVVRNTVKVNQIAVVDLAGTERQAATGSSGTILRQASHINSSLLVLRRCIDAMRKGHQQIPFRDSKLTRLLSPFFKSTRTRLALIVCISCCEDRLADSLNSIKFATTAGELLHPQEIINRFRETRRKSGEYRPQKNVEENTDVVQLPKLLFNEMQADIKTAEELAVEHERLRTRLQILEESAENAKLMYMDKIASMRKDHRSAMKALREEQDALRISIQEELLEEIEELTMKNQKYKKQSRTLVALVRERLYPELELFRSRYGHTEAFPPLTREDTKAFEPPDDEVQSCARCKSLEGSIDDISRKLQVQVHLHERLVEQLRSERELRVLLQETNRLPVSIRLTKGQESSMEITCQDELKLAADPGAEIEGFSSISGDSGNETAGSREKSANEGSALERLQEEKQQLHENLLHHMRLLDQKDLVLGEAEARIRHLEENYSEMQEKYQAVQVLLKQSEASRQSPAPATPCPIKCDRCLRACRLQEIPRTAPAADDGISAVRIRESAFSFTPVFCGRKQHKKILPRRRLSRTSSSEDCE